MHDAALPKPAWLNAGFSRTFIRLSINIGKDGQQILVPFDIYLARVHGNKVLGGNLAAFANQNRSMYFAAFVPDSGF